MPDANAIRAGRAVVEFAAERTPLYQGIKEIEGRLTAWTAGLGAAMAASGAATLWGLLPAVRAASDQAETLNAFTEVFRGANEEAERLAGTLANEVGRSVSSIRTIATPIGAMVKGLGLSADAAATFAHQAAAAALDIASFYNQDLAGVADRIRAALSGSSEAVDQFGINLRASALSAKLAELGYHSNLQSASELEKTLARLALIQESLIRQNAMGDAARTAGQFANASRTLSDALVVLQQNIGKALLPTVERITAVLARVTMGMADFVGRHPLLVKAFAAVAAAAVACGVALIGLVVTVKGLVLFRMASFAVGLLRVALTQLTPALALAATSMRTFLTTNSAAVVATQKLTLAFSLLGKAGQSYLLPFLARLPLLGMLIPIVKGVGAAFTLLSGPVGWTIAALAAVTAGAVALQRQFGLFTPLLEQFQSVSEAIAKKLQPAWAALGAVWSGQVLPALRDLGSALGAAWSEIGRFIGGVDRALGISSGFATVLKDLGELFSTVLVGGVKLLTATIETLTGALLAAYDAAAALGLVVSREERERGERLDREWDRRRKRDQRTESGEPGTPKPRFNEEQLRELDTFSKGVIEATKTPLERYREQMRQLELAFQAGKLTAEQFRRGQEQAQRDLEAEDPALQAARQQSQELTRFATSLREAVRTPEEQFREQMRQLELAFQSGELSRDEYHRGAEMYRAELEAARRQAREAEQRRHEEAQREAEQQARELRRQIEDRAQRRRQISSILAEEAAREAGLNPRATAWNVEQSNRLREIRDLKQAGFEDEARDKTIDLLGETITRARSLEEQARESQANARFGSFSRLEAVSGLGVQTIDEQLLKEAQDAAKSRAKALEVLQKIAQNLES